MKPIFWLSLFFTLGLSSDKDKFLIYNVQFYQTDNLGQIFVAQKDNSISKFSPNGNLIIAKNLKIQGDLSSIDVKNSFEYLFFYKNLNMLVTTDNLFNQRAMLNFNQNTFLSSKQIVAVHRSFDNLIWAFDVVSQRLIKINALGKISFESSSLPSQQNQHNIKWILEAVPYVFLVDTSEILIMNIYGKLLHTEMLLDSIYDARLVSDTLSLKGKQGVYRYYYNNTENKLIKTPVNKLNPSPLFLKSDSLFLRFK